MADGRMAADDRADFYRRIDPLGLSPLWESLHALVPPTPRTPVLPVLWDYDDTIRPRLMEAGALITAQEAQRRVLILENPGLRGAASITHSLYAGLQLILPGEVAPAHRHSQSALRFVIEGSGAYTAVDGERTVMQPGDFVITPAWTWHDHGNETDTPMVWLDGLDIPTVAFFDAGFAEPSAQRSQTVSRPVDDARARYGANLLPVDWTPQGLSSPLFSYPYARTRAALETMKTNGAPDPHAGYRMRYANPATGGHAMPTIGAFIQLVPAAFATLPYRSTDSTVYVVVEGSGRSTIAGERFAWKERDIFVAPSWAWQQHQAFGDAVLFSFSDRPAQQALGLWREDRAAAEAPPPPAQPYERVAQS